MGFLNAVAINMTRGSKYGKFVGKQPLTSKRGNRRFYKGKGCRNEGVHGKRGRYIVDQDKLLQIEVPDLTGFQLKPYVSPLTPRRKPVTAGSA